MKKNYLDSGMKEGIIVDKDRDLYLIIESTNQLYTFKSVEELELLSIIFWNESGEVIAGIPSKKISAQIQTGNTQIGNRLKK